MAILLWTVIRKVVGVPMGILVVPFRAWAANVVFNYVLQNDLYLQRLTERPLEWNEGEQQWDIGPYHGTDGGYIKYRYVSKLTYLVAYWGVFGWMDADSNQDTYDAGYNKTIVDGERFTWIGEGIKTDLARDMETEVFGNTFDLGDRRAEHPMYGFWSMLLWLARNSGYGFKYMQWEKKAGDPDIWLTQIGSWEFGWKMDDWNHENYSLVFGKWK